MQHKRSQLVRQPAAMLLALPIQAGPAEKCRTKVAGSTQVAWQHKRLSQLACAGKASLHGRSNLQGSPPLPTQRPTVVW